MHDVYKRDKMAISDCLIYGSMRSVSDENPHKKTKSSIWPWIWPWPWHLQILFCILLEAHLMYVDCIPVSNRIS